MFSENCRHALRLTAAGAASACAASAAHVLAIVVAEIIAVAKVTAIAEVTSAAACAGKDGEELAHVGAMTLRAFDVHLGLGVGGEQFELIAAVFAVVFVDGHVTSPHGECSPQANTALALQVIIASSV